MDLTSFDEAKYVVIKRKLDMLKSDLDSGMISPNEATGSLDQFIVDLDIDDALVMQFPRMIEDTFLRTEHIQDLCEAANINYNLIAARVDVASAMIQSITQLISTRSEAAKHACATAAAAVDSVQAYLSMRRKGSGVISVLNSDIDGNYSITDGIITSKINSSRNVSLTLSLQETNGRPGNLLELQKEVPGGRPLLQNEVVFSDPSNTPNKDIRKLYDRSAETLYEVEAYQIPDAVKNSNYIPVVMTEVVNGSEVQHVWDRNLEDGLYLDLTFDVSGSKLSRFIVDPFFDDASRISVARVDVSDDGHRWIEIDRNTILVPDVSTYVGTGKTMRGKGVWEIPIERVEKVRVRLVQDTPYTTKVAHAGYLQSNKDRSITKWVQGAAYKLWTNKCIFFSPARVSTEPDGSFTERHIIGLTGLRWCIPIKDIGGFVNTYTSTGGFTTKDYELSGRCRAVSISAVEDIPSGCEIKYEISPDRGQTWVSINPIERAGQGNEVIRFETGGNNNPNQTGVTYFATEGPAKSLRLRVTMKARDTTSPSLSSLYINPVVER